MIKRKAPIVRKARTDIDVSDKVNQKYRKRFARNPVEIGDTVVIVSGRDKGVIAGVESLNPNDAEIKVGGKWYSWKEYEPEGGGDDIEWEEGEDEDGYSFEMEDDDEIMDDEDNDEVM